MGLHPKDYFRNGYIIQTFGHYFGNPHAERKFNWDNEKKIYWEAPDAIVNSGRWLATLALEYNLTQDRKTLEKIETIIDHFIKLDLASGELNGFIHRTDIPKETTTEPSLDQYLGLLLGYKMVWDYVDDFKIRKKVYKHTIILQVKSLFFWQEI
jgi:hypothetical protein